jgi:thiamine-phosphate pyrophosphorylase
VVAIGGITRETVGEVARAGAACAAVIEACFGEGDASANVAALVRAFEAGRAGRGP